MASGATYVRMYVSRWRSGCLGLNLEQEGLYIRMCMLICETGRRVVLDDSQAAKMLAVQIHMYRRVLGDLLRLGKIKRHDDGYGNDRAEQELVRACGRQVAPTGPSAADADPEPAAPADGGAGRATVEGCGRQTDASAVDATAEIEGAGGETIPPRLPPPVTPPVGSKNSNVFYARSKTNEIKKERTPSSGSPTPRGARLDAAWTLPDDWRQWARVTWPQLTDAGVTAEAEKFADYWHAKAGQGATKLDWLATWRNWCRTAFAGRPGHVNAGRMGWDEQQARHRVDGQPLSRGKRRRQEILDAIARGASAVEAGHG